MNTAEISSIECYFKTENEHWNRYAFKILCEVLKQGDFETPETPLQLFDKAVNIFTELYKTPLKAFQQFSIEIDKIKMSPAQRLFVFEWVYKYVMVSDFGEIDTSEIMGILKSQTERLRKEKLLTEYNKPLIGNLRDILKDLMQKELEQLPNTLKELEPIQRLNILCKLIPYVLPKVESVTHTLGEPENETESKVFKW